ncbi:hypothetical protein FHE66_02740 [Georgenia sp. 311]|uniref:hypothetical protein n=1 Tax=Georgenia sp. 311 TaxID=2585134 RepID=UPI001111AD33|nr:hypothetical protein [Georgenia sp. 311]TNC19779.1 hypothetical protein FHE66_02740 [Georgenia sp. 311]
MTNFWWVNQGVTYKEERSEGILWAPMRTADSKGTRAFWDSLDKVEIGDVVIHYAGQAVKAVSSVSSLAVPTRRPSSLPSDMWEQDGRLVRVAYADVAPPIHREQIPTDWRINEPPSGPFQVNAGVKLGYLFPLSEAFFDAFSARFGARFSLRAAAVPSLPAEALVGAADLLRRLIGVPLTTLTGRTNIILGVTNGNAIVQTDKSLNGSSVPVSDVQHALEKLATDGAVTIHPDDVGYRSAFIGAVLSTLPGAAWAGSPPVLRIAEPTPGDAASGQPSSEEGRDNLTFQGDLSIAVTGVARGEQAKLRRRLFGSATVASCALCGERYPVRFLWAAHIKRRAVCSDPERRDIANVAMPACVFGCDALFESGYVTVDTSGRLRTAQVAETAAINTRLSELEGRPCSSYTAASASYFEWHRENMWVGMSSTQELTAVAQA